MKSRVDPLAGDALGKAKRQMRAIRRSILAYWYATIEGHEAALIEATNACLHINILDEAVFLASLGESYRDYRATTPGGQVVMGLELVRNCETHAPVAFDALLEQKRLYSVPLPGGRHVMRSVWHWAEYEALPTAYVESTSTANAEQKRARKEAQHAYREAVEGRSVIETLFDAVRFFTDLEPRLAKGPSDDLEYPLSEVPQGAGTVLHRPFGSGIDIAPLPDLATNWDERRAAETEPADRYVEDKFATKRKDPPSGEQRVVTHRIIDGDRLLGFAGVTQLGAVRQRWVERSPQIGRDIRSGYAYVVELDGDEIDVTSDLNLKLSALSDDGTDLLESLPKALPEYGLNRIRLVEEFPDLYLSMRQGL